MVKCIYCEESFESITPAHLKKHNVLYKDYTGEKYDMKKCPCGKPFKATGTAHMYCKSCAGERIRESVRTTQRVRWHKNKPVYSQIEIILERYYGHVELEAVRELQQV